MSNYDSIRKELLKNLNRYDLNPTDKKTIEIYQEYLKNCAWFQEYVIGNLDTFKKAACVMSAILKCKIVEETEKNDEIAFDISLSLIEKPSYYLGEKYDKEVPLDSISIKKLKNNTYLFETFRTYTLNSIQLNRERKEKNYLENQSLEEINIMSKAEDFRLLYQIVLFSQSPIKYYGTICKLEDARKKFNKSNSSDIKNKKYTI